MIPPSYTGQALLLLGLWFGMPSVEAQSYTYRHFSLEDGLSSNRVYCIAQDHQGYLWFGTETGVSRFNGQVFEQFFIEDGLSGNEVLKIYEDSQDRLWFLTFSGGLSYYQAGCFHHPNNDSSLWSSQTANSFISFYEDEQGNCWFGTIQREVYLYDTHNQLHQVQVQGLTQNPLKVYVFGQMGKTFWLSYQGLWEYQASQLLPSPSNYHKDLLYAGVNDCQAGPSGIVLASQEGFVWMDSLRQQLCIPIRHFPWKGRLGSLYIDRQENLWVNTLGGGSYCFRHFRQPPLDKEIYLPDKSITATLEDHEGNYWFSTAEEGVYMLAASYSNYVTYNQQAGLPSNQVFAVYKDQTMGIWAGMGKGNLSHITPEGIANFQLPSGVTSTSYVQQIVEDKAANIWLLMDDRLVYTTTPQKGTRQFASTPIRHSLQVSGLKSFTQSPKGKVALCSSYGVYGLDVEQKSTFKLFKDSSASRYYTAYYDSLENLWYASNRGLHRFDGRHIYDYSSHSPWLQKRITHIQSLNDSTLLLATWGYGLLVLQAGQLVQRITRTDGLPSNICRRLFVHARDVWLATPHGVAQLTHLLTDSLQIRKLDRTDGLISHDVYDVFADSSGLYVATSAGLSILRLPFEVLTLPPPPVHISVWLADSTVVSKSHVRLAYRQNHLRIQAHVIAYQQAQEVQLQYQLNDEWVSMKDHSLTFSALSPGSYRLQLRARHANSPWSKSEIFTWEIVPAFWQRAWFWVLMSMVSGIGVWALTRWRLRRQHAQQRQSWDRQERIATLKQQALQASMNPHFIFNVMNSIQQFLQQHDDEAAADYLARFAQLIRLHLELSGRNMVSLQEEIEYLQLYLYLEKLRLGEQLSYHFHRDAELDTEDIQIPSMLLQPFIENAIWHGIAPLKRAGKLDIHIVETATQLHIRILDDGQGFAAALPPSGHRSRGRSLTEERLALLSQLTGQEMHIDILNRSAPQQGTEVRILLPNDL